MPRTPKKVAEAKEVIETYIAEADNSFPSLETDFKKDFIASFAASALPTIIDKVYGQTNWRGIAAREAFEVGNAMYVEFEKQ